MSRPIILTEEMKQRAREDFAAVLDCLIMPDGKLNYSNSFTYKDTNAVVWLTPEAYKKTLALVTEFSDEVGWHGTVSRLGENEFTIEDIFVYPQEVTGSTVNTDQKEYTNWLYKLDDDTFNKIRMQGHSHVNMGVFPSGVDDKHRQQILEQLEPDMFYIFMIWNKSLTVHTLVYDMARNVLYEDKDVEVKLLDGEELEDFITDAKEKVQKQVFKKSRNGTKSQKAEHPGIYGGQKDYEGYQLFEMYDPYDLGGQAWRR